MNNAASGKRAILFAGGALAALVLAGPAMAQDGEEPAEQDRFEVEEVVVTAQRRAESLQNVPVAVSAFSEAVLRAQKVDGGPNLQLAVPNVSFSMGTRGPNFQIRGIGTKQFSAMGDTSTGVHFNNVPLTDNRLFEAEFFDVERVEVLRGPQGTLYGRNATGGVVNVITAKPTNVFEGAVRAEIGNFESRKLGGMLNIPLVDEMLSLRVAGNYVVRDGFVTNRLDGAKLDGRDLYSFRATLAFNPTENIETSVVWQRFSEDDDRILTGKSLCVRDPGPASVGGVGVTSPLMRGFLSQGCMNASLTTDAAFGTPNSLTIIPGLATLRAGLAAGDVFAGKRQSSDIDVVESARAPFYRAEEDVVAFNASWQITPSIQVSYLGSYHEGGASSGQDATLVQPLIPFLSTALSPDGVFSDPQLGDTEHLFFYISNSRESRQFAHEFRLETDFDGRVNGSIGFNTIDYKLTQEIYNMSPGLTAFARASTGAACDAELPSCIYVDPKKTPDATGHNYYYGLSPYQLKSEAVFGEIYFTATDTIKFTGGLRYTKDEKVLLNYPPRLLAAGRGVPQGNPKSFEVDFEAVTGRVGVDWKPELAFTNSTLLYAFYSRGYKGGGANPIIPTGEARQYYDPEYVDAFEIGSKNTLLDGSLTLNLAAFMYDYQGYQVTKLVNRVNTTENVDAEVKGLEFEALWQPTSQFRLNMSGGLLDTEITTGSSIDTFRRTQEDPTLTFVKNASAGACAVPTEALATLIGIIQEEDGAPFMAGVSGNPMALLSACSGTYAGLGVVPIEGRAASLKGNELPNAPKWTVSLGAQYTWELTGAWEATVRGDYYEQGESFGRVYNDAVDEIPGWSNVNASVKFTKVDSDLDIELYVKNLLDDRPITDHFYNDDALGLSTRSFFAEPRMYYVSVSKRF